MAVRRNTTNRLTLYRTCHTCGKSIVTTADTPFVRQILVEGKQRTCYFCSEACKRASYKYSGWWDGLADARRKAREAARDVREKNRRYYAPLTLIRSVRGQRSAIGETQMLQELIADIKGQKDV